jgi:phosphate transport system permease protein
MSSSADSLRAGPARAAAAPLTAFSTRFARRRLFDILARRGVTLGGLSIIGSILAILFVIAGEAYPLLRPVRVSALAPEGGKLDSAPLAITTDEYQSQTVIVTSGAIWWLALGRGVPPARIDVPTVATAKIETVSAIVRERLALGLSDGRVIPAEIRFTSAPASPEAPEIRFAPPLVLDAAGRPIRLLGHAAYESGSTTAAVTAGKVVSISRVHDETSLAGETTRDETKSAVELATRGVPTALTIDGRGDDLFVATDAGELVRVDVRGREPRVATTKEAASRPGSAITALGFVLGERTLVVGDAAGGVATWQLLPNAEGTTELVRIHSFPAHAAPVTMFSASRRHKGFWTGDATGELHYDYATTGQNLVRLSAGARTPTAFTFAPKADGLLVAEAEGRLLHWSVDCPHPEVSWSSLFGKLWYEGYPEPAYVWQSTGGSDDFEAKLSLVPLIFGTLKGTFYALLFAVPIALASALYVSQFMHPRVKAHVKPTVEVMAALPSVVLGFMAGLWLAPAIERIVPGLIVSPLVVSAFVLLTLAAWRAAPHDWRTHLAPGTEAFVLIPVVVGGLWLSFSIGSWMELHWLRGDYRSWLGQVFGVTYDQRNSLVVGIAMGFAVVPVIFTIAEDSLANVPPHLVAGSLALGATRWPTAVRVILPSASPGIFSAIMIGFGRAVGETMIVLMATGNTPVLSGSMFNGFRALSANIAVELPEAPEGGTLFRVLFVAALLLFAMTFAVNTVAELVRLRLREKYRTL